jgi:predicted CXXCH cytochrome family protein
MCHDGTGASTNIKTEFGTGMRVSFHPVPAPSASGATLVCSDCHAEHQSPSEDAGLLYLTLGPESFRLSPPADPIGNDFCYSCHPDYAATQNQVVHNQVDAPNPDTGVTCNACHEPHASDYTHLTKASEENLCYTCHTDKPDSAAGSQTYNAFHAAANDYGSPVRIYHHPVASAEQAGGTRVVECASCHNTHLPGNSLVVDPRDTTRLWMGSISAFCMTCHQNPPPNDPVIPAGPKVPYAVRMVLDGHDRFRAAQWPNSTHGESGRGIECTDCHNQHGSSNAYMLIETGGLTGFTDRPGDWANLQTLCETCHDAGDVQDHINDPEFAGQQCTSCHYHTSERL